jgi:hypothetical protein
MRILSADWIRLGPPALPRPVARVFVTVRGERLREREGRWCLKGRREVEVVLRSEGKGTVRGGGDRWAPRRGVG